MGIRTTDMSARDPLLLSDNNDSYDTPNTYRRQIEDHAEDYDFPTGSSHGRKGHQNSQNNQNQKNGNVAIQNVTVNISNVNHIHQPGNLQTGPPLQDIQNKLSPKIQINSGNFDSKSSINSHGGSHNTRSPASTRKMQISKSVSNEHRLPNTRSRNNSHKQIKSNVSLTEEAKDEFDNIFEKYSVVQPNGMNGSSRGSSSFFDVQGQGSSSLASPIFNSNNNYNMNMNNNNNNNNTPVKQISASAPKPLPVKKQKPLPPVRNSNTSSMKAKLFSSLKSKSSEQHDV